MCDKHSAIIHVCLSATTSYPRGRLYAASLCEVPNKSQSIQYSISISTNGRPLGADRFASVPDQREYTSHCWLFITIKILRQLTGKIPPINNTGIDSNKTQQYHTYNTTQHSEVRRVSVGCSLVPFHHMVWITFRIINPLIKTYQNRFFGQGPCSLSHNVPSSLTDRCLTYSLSRTPPGLFWTSASH